LVSGWRDGVGRTKIVRTDHEESEDGEEQNAGFPEYAKGLCGL